MNEPHTSAKARGFVMDADGNILLVRHREDKPWTLPGGHIELGETPHQAFVREMLEETGLHIELTGSTVGLPAGLDELPTPIANYGVHYITEDGAQVVKFEYIFSACVTSGSWKLQDEEVVDFGWFSREEILTMDGSMLYPQIQTLLHRI